MCREGTWKSLKAWDRTKYEFFLNGKVINLQNVTSQLKILANLPCVPGDRDEDLASPAPKNCAPEFRRWKYLQIRSRSPLGRRSHLLEEPPLCIFRLLYEMRMWQNYCWVSTPFIWRILDETTDGEVSLFVWPFTRKIGQFLYLVPLLGLCPGLVLCK